MDGALLVTGKYGPVSEEIVREMLNHGARVFATYDPETEQPQIPDGVDTKLTWLPWSRRSILSARSVLLGLEIERAVPERVIIVAAPEGVHSSLHETGAAAIESTVDTAVKGYLFVAKEILAAFNRIGAGDLTVLWYDGGAEVMPPIDATIAGSVRGLVTSLFTFYNEERIVVRGLEASESDPRLVARWVRETIVDRGPRSAGRWSRYGHRGGIIPFRR